MECLHPGCPRHGGARDWVEVLDRIGCVKPAHRDAFIDRLNSVGPPGIGEVSLAAISPKYERLLLRHCPCLYTQARALCPGSAVAHLCECTLGEPISGQNVVRAFDIQHPDRASFLVAPLVPCASAGDVSEALCSDVLSSAGVPAMTFGADGWPVWAMPGHILLNRGKMKATKAFGDILIPAAPTNLVVSVKTQAARERLLYSSNAIEAVGFGFFTEAKEFWTKSRMRLFKRMGFTAIYIPPATLTMVTAKLAETRMEPHAINVNGSALYRSIEVFGSDMRRIVGRVTLDL